MAIESNRGEQTHSARNLGVRNSSHQPDPRGFGSDNAVAVARTQVGPRLDVDNVGYCTATKQVTEAYYTENVLDNIGIARAEVLRVVKDDEDTEFSIKRFLSSGVDGKRLKITARVREIHSCLPYPSAKGDKENGLHNKILDMHDVFIGKESVMQEPQIGSMIWVDWENKRDFKGGIYVGLVNGDGVQAPSTGGGGSGSAIDAHANAKGQGSKIKPLPEGHYNPDVDWLKNLRSQGFNVIDRAQSGVFATKSAKRKKPPLGVAYHVSSTRSWKKTEAVLAGKGLSTHWEVERDGTIIYYLDPAQRFAYATGSGNNSRVVGVDLTHKEGQNWPKAQIKAMKAVTREMQKAFGFTRKMAPDRCIVEVLSSGAEARPGGNYLKKCGTTKSSRTGKKVKIGELFAEGYTLIRHRNVHATACPGSFPVKEMEYDSEYVSVGKRSKFKVVAA